MKKTFVGKPNILTFLGMASAIGVAAIFANSCNKKEPVEREIPLKKNPETKVVKQEVNEIEDDNRRVIYLTFDDGPNKGTENLLKIVEKHKIPITSFVVGKHIFGSKKQLQEFEKLQNDTLVEIANHSFSHANNKYSEYYNNPEQVVQDFNQVRDSANLKTYIARTPGRNIWRLNNVNETDIKKSKEAADLLQTNNYKLVGWDLEWKHDGRMQLKDSHEVMLKRIDSIFYNDLEKTSRHLVLLSHDQYLTDESSVNELDLLITKLQKSQRFRFKKISSYPEINKVLN